MIVWCGCLSMQNFVQSSQNCSHDIFYDYSFRSCRNTSVSYLFPLSKLMYEPCSHLVKYCWPWVILCAYWHVFDHNVRNEETHPLNKLHLLIYIDSLGCIQQLLHTDSVVIVTRIYPNLCQIYGCLIARELLASNEEKLESVKINKS